MPTPTTLRTPNQRIILPPECVFYVDPNTDRRKITLTDWAGLYGKSIGLDPHQDLSIVDAEVWGPNAIKVRSLNGSSDYMYCSSHSSIDITSVSAQEPLSVFGVINVDVDQISTSGYIICKNNSSFNDVQYGYYVTPTAISVWLNGNQRAVSPNVINKGSWQFVGFTFDGSNVNIYVNSTLVRTTAYVSANITSAPNFAIGRRAPDNAYLKCLVGPQFICRSYIQDIMLWANKVKLFQKYNIAG